MSLRSYLVSLEVKAYGKLIVEIHTKFSSINKEEYIRIMMEVLNYLGEEGYFDVIRPSSLAIYDKADQIVNIEDNNLTG